MTRLSGFFVPFLLLLLCVPPVRVQAQTVRATVVDAATGAPVAEALVRVRAEDGTLASAVFTGADGTAVLRLRREGGYQVTAERGGYDPAGQPVSVEPRGTARVELRMSRRPFTIDTVEVIARGRDERGRDGFERRRRMHEGVFLDSAYLSQRRAAEAIEFMAGVPGVQMAPTRNGPRPRSTRGWRCMVLLVDGHPPPGGRPLNRMVYARDVVAMEVFREYNEVPPEYRVYARQGMYSCGVYVYWTRVRW